MRCPPPVELNTPIRKIDGVHLGQNLGYSLAEVGEQVVVGAPAFGSVDEEVVGRGYLIDVEGESGSASDHAIATLEGAYRGWGEVVGAFGDVSGDGMADIVIGGGVGFAFYSAPQSLRDWSSRDAGIHDRHPSEYDGTGLPARYIMGPGDLDGDGVEDVLISGLGTWLFEGPLRVGLNEGDESDGRELESPAVWWFRPVFGQDGSGGRWWVDGPESNEASLSGSIMYFGSHWNSTSNHEVEFIEFASGARIAQDMDGDNADELVMGSHMYDGGRGRVDMIRVDPDGLQVRGTLWAPTGAQHFGFALAAADFDSDGRIDDLAVGAPAGPSGAPGSVYVYLDPMGDGECSSEPDFRILSVDTGNLFGRALAAPSPTGSLVVGAPGHEDGRGQLTLWSTLQR